MIRFLERNQINDAAWDNCIDSSPFGQVFAYTWYLDICCPGWFGLVADEYDAVFPLAIRSKFGIPYTYQPFFTRHFGVFAKAHIKEQLQTSLFNALPRHIRYHDFCLHTGMKQAKTPAHWTTRKYQQLDLTLSYADIRERYNDNLKRNLRKAEKHHLILQEDYQPEELVEQFQIHTGEKGLGFGEGDFVTLQRLMTEAQKRLKTWCWSVRSESDELLAAAFFMESKGRILYLKGFSTETGKQCGAMHLLFDSLIKSAAGKAQVLDFGGSSDAGVARFYQAFGSRDCVYLHMRRNSLPKLLRWLKP